MFNYRNVVFFCMTFFLIAAIQAQPPQQFNYQAVVRDDAGSVITNEEVTIEVAIVQGSMEGETVFTEMHHTETNDFGMVNLQIGSVTSLEDIHWESDEYYVMILLNDEVMGVTQLLSVPYALHSQTSADSFSGDYDDLENTPDLDQYIDIEAPEAGDLAWYTGENWQSLTIGEEEQVLTVSAGEPHWADPPCDDIPDSVTDIDGNEYETVMIGNQLWMAENLRTTRYRDGTDIPTGLSDTDWANTEDGAYAVYPHNNVTGIDSASEMVDIFGKLYNFMTIENDKGLCPEGWRVGTADDYDGLAMYVAYWGGNKQDEHPDKDESVAGNYLKSCRQINSPLGGDCDTEEHPRWEADNDHYGTDEFGFNALPAGYRNEYGTFTGIGEHGYFWTSTELSFAMGRWRRLWNSGGWFYSGFEYKEEGYSVRCIKE